MTSNYTTQHKANWQKVAQKLLLGRKIVAVSWMTDEERQDAGWEHTAVVLVLDNGYLIWPSADGEGNDAGALFGQDQKGVNFYLPAI